MNRNFIGALLPLLAVLAVPIALRRSEVEDNPTADQLVVVSPHNEAIRYEFERAFRQFYRERHGRDVDIDWRTPGGTSEIVRYVNSEYIAAFRHHWTNAGRKWTTTVQSGLLDRKLKPSAAAPEAWEARQAFLAGNVGIGIDVFFGGGQYDFGRMADQGLFVPCGLRDRHPELFSGNPPILQQQGSGEIWFDPEDRYYGTCLSAFGLCYNLDRVAELSGTNLPTHPFPRTWEHLADPRFIGAIGVADPSKSGSIAKCFEMLIQQRMAQTLAAPQGLAAPRAITPVELAEGWDDALLLIRRIAANARYFTFSAGKVPSDVAAGTVAAGMCIDFYGRSQAEWEQQTCGMPIMRYVTPLGGSSVSADPVAILRGAPHPHLAQAFIDFVLSRAGQQLWNYRPGTVGGPEEYALRRLPIRRDLYSAADRSRMSDPDAHPFELAQRFIYHPEWTARFFGLIRVLVRVMCIDCHDELRAAWSAIQAAGGPAAVPEALAHFRALPFSYTVAEQAARALQTPRRRLEVTREWSAFFRNAYAAAQAAAAGQDAVRRRASQSLRRTGTIERYAAPRTLPRAVVRPDAEPLAWIRSSAGALKEAHGTPH